MPDDSFISAKRTVDCMADPYGISASHTANTHPLINRLLIDLMLIAGGIVYVFAELFLDFDSPLCGVLIACTVATNLCHVRR